jgi:hypothetical protein
VADEDDVGVERARRRDVTERALQQRDFRHSSDARSVSSLTHKLAVPQADLALADRKPSIFLLETFYVQHIRHKCVLCSCLRDATALV